MAAMTGGKTSTEPSITRLSRVTYRVDVPSTEEQAVFIEEVVKRCDLKRQEEEYKETHRYNPRSLGEFRHDCCKIFDIAMSITAVQMAEGGFAYTNESMVKISHAFAELRNVLSGGGIQAKPRLQREGNVIYLGKNAV